MNINNPFFVRGYGGPKYFCDRVKETDRLVSAVRNERDVTLIAPRRYGKTGLIRNAFHVLESECAVVYIDIYSTRNLAEFTKMFVDAVVGALDTKAEKAIANVARFFRSCRPTMTPQEVGFPKFSFDVAPSSAEATLKEAFDYIVQRDRRLVVAIDEFQQILEYPETGTEALLRSYMQFAPQVHFIFSGSRRHMMREMFMTPKHPFYQSTDVMTIDVIDRGAYASFARAFFNGAGCPFEDDVFARLYDHFGGITWYVQIVLNKLWEYGEGVADDATVASAVDELVETRAFEFAELLRSQNDSAQLLLRAMAAAGVVSAPQSGEFLAKCGLKAASTVASALESLIDKDLVYRGDDGYVVYDRFFGLWLADRAVRLSV